MILEVSGVSRSFGGVRAVKDMSLRLADGELRAVIGPNGAGKSTLFSLIAGRLSSEGGSIRFEGKSIDRLPPHRRAKLGISIMYQTPASFGSMTTLESVMLGAHRLGSAGFIQSIVTGPRQRAEERRLRTIAEESLQNLGLQFLADRPTEELSFGQLRRVQLARALAAKPKLLLLDEPASGLHRHERVEFADTLVRLRESGVTMVLIEHDVDLVMKVADAVTVMNLGSKLAEGTPEAIQRDPAVIGAYLGGEVAADGPHH